VPAPAAGSNTGSNARLITPTPAAGSNARPTPAGPSH
jgi:hypothetical protein